MADTVVNATAIQTEVNVVNVAMISLGDTVKEIASIVAENFGQMTKRVNLFGTNVAKRLERIAAANKEIAGSFGEMGKGAGSGLADAAGGAKDALTDIGGGLGAVGENLGALGAGVGSVGTAMSSLGSGLASVGGGVTQLGSGLLSTADGAIACAAALPALGTAILAMAVNVSGVTAYIPELLVLGAVLTVFSLLGEGLALAGTGLMGIGQGMLLMGEALPVVAAGMAIMIQQLSDTTLNLSGVLTFVLLAASMFIMALAIEKINEHLTPMVTSLGSMGNILSTSFVVGITVFTVMMTVLSAVLGKVASGMDKVTSAMGKQVTKLGILIPLQATSAVLSNPIVGAITVAAATVAGFAMKAIIPQLATGGVAYGPTYAMIGEGRYPEAVIPLGSSPQFSSMKNEIASAVLQGLAAMRGDGASSPIDITLNLDGVKFARAILPKLEKENGRKGYVNLKEI